MCLWSRFHPGRFNSQPNNALLYVDSQGTLMIPHLGYLRLGSLKEDLCCFVLNVLEYTALYIYKVLNVYNKGGSLFLSHF